MAIIGIGSSQAATSGASQALALARKSLLQKNLNTLGTAIKGGDIDASKRAFRTLVTNNPQYKTASTAQDGETPLDADFRALAKALDKNNIKDAQTTWTKTVADMEKQGLVLTDGNQAAAQARSTLTSYTQSTLYDAAFTGGKASLFSSWMIYSATGKPMEAAGGYSAGSFLNFLA